MKTWFCLGVAFALFVLATTARAAALESPNLFAPLNGGTNIALQPCFSWGAVNTSGVSYNLVLSDTSDFPSRRWVLAGLTGTSACFGSGAWYAMGSAPPPPSQLANGTRYYWKVVAIKSGYTDGHSVTYSLETMMQPQDDGWGAWLNIGICKEGRQAQIRVCEADGGQCLGSATQTISCTSIPIEQCP